MIDKRIINKLEKFISKLFFICNYAISYSIVYDAVIAESVVLLMTAVVAVVEAVV